VTPVILLAFANDKQNSGAGYLRGLTLERNSIRDALLKAEENGLCQVVVEPDASVDRIFDLFQNSQYRDRIAIFHYGGHAESYSLLLESASGGKVKAHSEGLVSFLAKQSSLKLVFLNGCSSQKQSEELVAANLPAVIGTSQSINDTVATGLATRFYKGISAGVSIERAWVDAIDQIKTENGTAKNNGLYSEGILGSPGEDQFPWKLYTGEGGETSKAWNLPEAANQPLFGLELPLSYYRDLPLSPYPGLRSFKRKEGAIFYGRGNDIRHIYTQLSREQPLILVSGKKGVGKSSLFAAGLAPRLESGYTVSFSQLDDKNIIDAFSENLNQARDAQGLEPLAPKNLDELEEKIAAIDSSISNTSGFAREILNNEKDRLTQLSLKESLNYLEQWKIIEEKTGKPLVVLMDELPDDPKDMKVFVEILFSIFDTKTPPEGKIILSVDEDDRGAYGEILQAVGFPFIEVFLKPLDWDGINEAIAGVTLSPSTKDYYRLQIENNPANNFPSSLRGNLSDGDTTLVAPYLQVIMSEIWKSAIEENAQSPSITMRSYKEGILSGDIMDNFLTTQLTQLKEWKEEEVESGLALDLLYRHTSALGKSHILDATTRKYTYPDRQDTVRDLVLKCKELNLLSSAHLDGTNLGHNLLAQMVIRQYSISLSPGQQAARILNGKTGETAEQLKTSWLNEADLEIVENGMKGMRSLTEEEETLLELSRVKKIEAQQDRKRNRIIRAVLISIVGIFAILAAWQWRVAYHRYLYSRAGELAFKAKEMANQDNTLALNIARQAYSVLNAKSPPEVMQTLSEIFHSQEKTPFYAAKFLHTKIVNTAVFSPDGKNVLTASEDGLAKLWDLKGKELLSLSHGPEVFMASFSPNGQQILTLTRTHVYLWERDGKLTDKDTIPETMTTLDSFTTDGMKIIPNFVKGDSSYYNLAVSNLRQTYNNVIASPARNRILVNEYGTCTLFDENGNVLRDSLTTTTIYASFSQAGDKFLTSSNESDHCRISVWSERGDSLYSFRCEGEKVNAVFSPDGKAILTASSDFTAKIWDFSDPFLHRFPRQTQAMNTVDYFPDGNRYLSASWDSTAKIWDGSGHLIDSLKHGDIVNSASFSPDGQYVITASRDSTSRIWSMKESNVIMLPHGAEVTSATFSHTGKFVLTSSFDKFVRLWTLDGQLVKTFPLNGDVSTASFSPDDKHILSVSSDSTATLFNVDGDSLRFFKHCARVNSAAFSPDGQYLLTSCADSIVRQWSLNGELLLSLAHNEKPRIALYTSDGKHILTGGRIVKIWSNNGILEDSLSHLENVSSIKVSPDGNTILTTCIDQNAYLWNFTGDLLATYRNHTAKINSGFFTPDGTHILTAADDGYILRWKTPQAIFSNLETAVISQLSKKEMVQYGVKPWSSRR